VIIQTALKEELGAAEFVRGDSRRTGTVSLRVALNGFDLVWPDDRKLKTPSRLKPSPLAQRAGPSSCSGSSALSPPSGESYGSVRTQRIGPFLFLNSYRPSPLDQRKSRMVHSV
jgi:hypothetical protein